MTIGEGAAIGARAVCVAPVTVGRWALVAAGAVVTKDVPDFALVVGVPARRVGWVGRAGVPLAAKGDGIWVCPETGAELPRDRRPAQSCRLTATALPLSFQTLPPPHVTVLSPHSTTAP